MDTAAVLHPYIGDSLSLIQLDQVSTYLDLLLRWNEKTNLTSVRDPEHIVSRHFGESFFLATQRFWIGGSQLPDYRITRLPDQGSPTQSEAQPLAIIDLGSGAGFPAIPLLIFRPDLTLTLVEAHHTKAVFLREVLRALHLEAEVKNVRAENLPPASADLVTLRAVEKFDSILPTAARLVRPEPEATEDDEFVDAGGPRLARGLALLIGSSQIPQAQKLLPTWCFHPEIPIPNAQKRVIQLVEPK